MRINQFAADFVKNLRGYMGGDDRVLELLVRSSGYMYLADNEEFAGVLRESQQMRLAAGAYITGQNIRVDGGVTRSV